MIQNMNNQVTDWEKIFAKLNYYTPSRKEVISRLTQDGQELNEDTVLNAMDMLIRDYFKEKGWLGRSDVVDSEIFPEVVDTELRKLCHQINSSGFARTTNCCSGHKLHKAQIDKIIYGYKKYKQIKFSYGYCDPYLALLFNMDDPRSHTYINKLTQQMDQFKKKQRVIIEEKIRKQTCHMEKGEIEKCIRFKQKDFWVEDHVYSAIFYPKELENKREQFSDKKFLQFYYDELMDSKWYDFAVSNEAYSLSKQFFQIFHEQFKSISS